MQRVTLALNPVDPNTWQTVEVDNICDYLISQFDAWPKTARIYHGNVSVDNDVTPQCEDDILKLLRMPGPFYVINYPAGPVALAIIAVVVVVAAVVLLKPSIPNPALRNTQTASSNNELAQRSNKPRLNARIPDIFGTVRSTPDLIALPYNQFINHQEVEYAYMCIGRGYYNVSDLRDDTTLISDIAGATVQVYGPNTSPNSGNPQLTVGTPITAPVVNAYKSNAVNGQVVRSPNNGNYTGDNDIYFVYPNEIHAADTSSVDFTNIFQSGDIITISGATLNVTYTDSTTGTLNLNGTYTDITVAAKVLTLSNPGGLDADWNKLQNLTNRTSPTCSASLATSGDKWVGPFVMDNKGITSVYANFVALNGLYKDDGTNQYRFDIVVELEITPVNNDATFDSNGNVVTLPTTRGPAQTFQATVEGSATTRTQRAVTLSATPSLPGPYSVRARRVTASDLSFKGTVVDEVKMRDLYAVSPVSQTDFGNVTTVQSVTYATSGALAVKDRKLNMLVTRKLPLRVSGSTFTTDLHPTNSAADILAAICLDPFIGKRQASEIDFDSIYNTVALAQAYFGTEKAVEFNYTFDSDNLSFEETVSSIANAIFCTAFRRGNVIKLSFEQQTEDSVLLFNHRNKLPGSETRTIRFGNDSNYDGIEYQYVDPTDDALISYYLPEDRSATNAKQIQSIGIRSKLQAHLHAWREWNKVRYQNVLTEFTATQEADLLVIQDRILVADNTRPDTQDGEVLAQDGLQLTLSQNVSYAAGISYTIFLQHIDGTVEPIAITPGSNANQVILTQAPAQSLALDDSLYARTTYIIVGNTDARANAFLVSEKKSNGNFTSTVSAVNYDDRYYANDKDYINGVIDINGNAL